MLWTSTQPAEAASPVAAELTRDTQRLADIVRESAEEGGPISPPIMVSTNCVPQQAWWTGRCEATEALVPFRTAGPGSAVWDYVALFRITARETKSEGDLRGPDRDPPKRVALVGFAFIPEPFGIIDWASVQVERGYVVVQTKHWVAGDGHSNPSGPGRVRIDLDGGLKLTNVP